MKDDIRPTFSIIVPVYNAELVINRCLSSLSDQTCTDFEIVFVNDGSQDNSLSVLSDYMNAHTEMRITIINQINSGAGQARNNGIVQASGKYLMFLDADDYLDNNFIEDAKDTVLRENPDLIFIDIIRESASGEIIRFEKMSAYRGLNKESMIRQQLTGKIPWGGVRKIVKAEIVKEGHHQYGHIPVGEESIYSFGILRDAKTISFMTGVYYHYIDNSQSLTSNDKPERSEMVFEYICNELRKKKLYTSYEKTINSLAATTVVIIINVLAKQKSFTEARMLAREYLAHYEPYIKSQMDYDALEKRVKICLPFLKINMVVPIIIASYLQSTIKRLRCL